MNQPFKAVCSYFHFIVHALKDQMSYGSVERAFSRSIQNNILGTDNNIHGTVCSKTGIYTGKAYAQDFYQFILKHDPSKQVAVADEVGHKCVFRFVIDFFGRTDLLDIALVHNHNGVRHGKGFFLVMGDIDKGNAQFIL